MVRPDWPTAGSAAYVSETAAVITDLQESPEPMPWQSGKWHNIQSTVEGLDHGGTQALIANQIYGCPIWVPKPFAIDRVGIAVQTGAGSVTRLMAHLPLADGMPGALLFDFGTVGTSSGGDKEITVAQTLPAGMLWLTCLPDAAITAYAFEGIGSWSYAGSPTQGGGTDFTPNRANGSMTAPNPFGTSGVSWVQAKFLRLAVRGA